MHLKKSAILASVLFAASSAAALAQTAPAAPAQASTVPAAAASEAVPEGGIPTFVRPETPQQRNDRIGTTEDPGMNPAPTQHFWRYGHSYHISKYERKNAIYDQPDPTMVRPLGMVNFAYEIYQQNDKYVWVWVYDQDLEEAANPPVTESAAPEGPVDTETKPGDRYSADEVRYFRRIRPQFSTLTPPPANKTISFEDSSAGLPTSGSWRNSLAVADMNGDGFPDLIVPPARKGNGFPTIFLGDGKGHWKVWNTKWSRTLDYGSVVVADFNKDGHMDVAFSVHLSGVFAFLGDGKGNFTESSQGLPTKFPTRRLVTADVDHDGYPDLVVISEGPTAGETHGVSKVRAYLNRKKGQQWEEADVTDPSINIGGDYLAVGDFNGDRYLDVLAGSVYLGTTQIVNLSEGPKKWKPVFSDGDLLPSRSYYLANAVGKFTSSKLDDAIISYIRYWPTDIDQQKVTNPSIVELTNVDRLTFTKDGLKRVPIARWSGHVGVWGLATGDFNGDGNLDIAFTRDEPERRLDILLGDGKGNFSEAVVNGVPLPSNRNYDVKVADLNGDGLPDIILMYESGSTTSLAERTGSIKVYLNRGARSTAPAASAAGK